MFLGGEPQVGLENKYKMVSFEYILRLKNNFCLTVGNVLWVESIHPWGLVPGSAPMSYFFQFKKHYGIISETSLRNNPISFFCFTSFWQRFPPPHDPPLSQDYSSPQYLRLEIHESSFRQDIEDRYPSTNTRNDGCACALSVLSKGRGGRGHSPARHMARSPHLL